MSFENGDPTEVTLLDVVRAIHGTNQRLEVLAVGLEGTNRRLDGTNERLEGLGGRVDDLGRRVDDLGRRFDDLGHRFDDLGSRVDETNERLGDLSAEVRSGFHGLDRKIDATMRRLTRHDEQIKKLEAKRRRPSPKKTSRR